MTKFKASGGARVKLKFHVDHPGEMGAGIRPYNDLVVIKIDSGDPGGEDGEFAEYMRDCLRSWYDGAFVMLEDRLPNNE